MSVMFGNRMAKPVVVLCSIPPQIEPLWRFGILKPPVPPPSALRFPSFCCKASSSAIQCNRMSSSTRIFIKGLPLSTSEGRLRKVFSEFGEVTQVKVPIDKESGKSVGFAYIGFVKEESVQSAVEEMNGKDWSYRKLSEVDGDSLRLTECASYRLIGLELSCKTLVDN